MLSRKQGFGLAVALILDACGGLDPGAFRGGSSGGKQAVAGFAFDAGTPGGSGGRDGSAPAPRGGASGTRGAGSRAGEPEGGAAGEPGDGGSPGESEGGAGGRSNGAGAGGRAGGVARGGAGGSGGGNAGSSARGGQGGAAGSGGATGASGSAGASAGRGGSASHALYFSEYVEGSSSYKALEITAGTDATLAGCRLVTYFNGAATGSGIVLDGAVSVNAPYVLCSTQLATLLGTVCARATNLTYNGDDAIALECAGEAVDVIGQIGVDPGDAWGSGEATTLNHTLRRRCPALPDTDGADPFEPAARWEALPVDTFDGLGHADCAGP